MEATVAQIAQTQKLEKQHQWNWFCFKQIFVLIILNFTKRQYRICFITYISKVRK